MSAATAQAQPGGNDPPPVLRRDEGAVAVLTLNRPASRNSLSRAMLAALREALAGIGGDEGIRCVVVAAEGPVFAASCDLVVAAEGARFCTPGVDIGLFCSTPGVALARAVPRKAAMEMLLLGEMVPAAEAHRIGLVNRVVPAGQALPAALDLARRIASRSAVALRLGKRGVNAQLGQPLDRAYEAASRVMVENMLAEDAAEGMGAFLAKRRPEWRHR